MPTRNRIALAVFVSLIAITALAVQHKTFNYFPAVLADQEQSDESQIPVADYSAAASANLAERAKRKEKGRRYAGKRIKEDPRITVVTDSESSVERLVPLPISNSDVVVIGEVRNAAAYLSDDKSGIYSEFCIRIEQVLKSNGDPSFNPGSEIIAEREGGGVRFPSGHVQHYVVSSERMPRVWGRYVFFLKGIGPGQDLLLLKGYELRAGRVFPMDALSRDDIYKGMDQDVFVNAVRDATLESSNSTPAKVRQDQ